MLHVVCLLLHCLLCKYCAYTVFSLCLDLQALYQLMKKTNLNIYVF